ncbi:MAG TPA: hypothetical protein VML96_06980 [Egibacteraceae bacterium]|nr:hypothetical protein [Egibacteraceae bacterium]
MSSGNPTASGPGGITVRPGASADEPADAEVGSRVLRLVGLVAGSTGGVECVQEVSEADYRRYEAAAAQLRRFSTNDTYALVVRSHTRFRMRSAAYAQRAAAEEMPVSWRTAFVDLLGELMSCLASAQLFLDRTQNWLAEDETRAAAREAFDEALARALAKSFPFRFLCAMRGYVERCGLPPGRVTSQVRLVREDGRHDRSVVLELFRDGLLEDPAAPWGPLRDELRREHDRIDVTSCLSAMMKHLEDIMRAGLAADLDALSASADVIEDIAAPVLSRSGDPHMITMHLDPRRDSVRKVGMQPVPVDLLALARERCPRS